MTSFIQEMFKPVFFIGAVFIVLLSKVVEFNEVIGSLTPTGIATKSLDQTMIDILKQIPEVIILSILGAFVMVFTSKLAHVVHDYINLPVWRYIKIQCKKVVSYGRKKE
jgi:hypothetical protein